MPGKICCIKLNLIVAKAPWSPSVRVPVGTTLWSLKEVMPSLSTQELRIFPLHGKMPALPLPPGKAPKHVQESYC